MGFWGFGAAKMDSGVIDLTNQGPGQTQYRRKTAAPGRSPGSQNRQPECRRACFHLANHLRRAGGHAAVEQIPYQY